MNTILETTTTYKVDNLDSDAFELIQQLKSEGAHSVSIMKLILHIRKIDKERAIREGGRG